MAEGQSDSAGKNNRSRRKGFAIAHGARCKQLEACYCRGMTLREFLTDRARDTAGPAGDRLKIREYSDAVKSLMKRFRDVLSPYEALEIVEWLPLLKERSIPYNAPALTVNFRDDQITIEPKGAFVLDSAGRVSMTRGMREVHIDWAGGNDWVFRWVLPRTTNKEPLTNEAIEDLVQGLLA